MNFLRALMVIGFIAGSVFTGVLIWLVNLLFS